MNLGNLSFPIYTIGKEEPQHEDGVHFYLKYDQEKEKETRYIIDDKNLPGNSLASRRLALKLNGSKLHGLKYSVFFIGDLIKIQKSYNWFIDSEGTVFNYVKTKRVPLVYREIGQLIPSNHGGAIVEVKGIGTRFKVLHAPTGQVKYAGLLLVDHSYILYGLYEEKLQDTWRMV